MRRADCHSPCAAAFLMAVLGIVGCGGGGQGAAGTGGESSPGGTGPGGASETTGAGGTASAGAGGAQATGGVATVVVGSGGFSVGGRRGAGGAPGSGGALGNGGEAGAPLADAAADAPGRPGTGGSVGNDGSPAASEVGGPTECPAPPAGAPASAIAALNAENAARVAMGIPCASLVLTLCTSAQNHCDYYTANQGSSTCEASSAHNEVANCPKFTGADPGARIKAAGYSGGGWSECMAFLGDPAGAVKMFIDSVYHRTPVLSPWYRDMGYGSGTGCDTIDFGTGASTPKTVTAHYPYDGQTEVPVSFNGAQEGPTPPVPSTGWPSGYPVTLYGQGITVSAHQIMVDGTTTSLAHQWLDGDSTLGSSAKVLYTDAPLTANTTYRVIIEGATSSASVRFEWTFTTGAGSTGGGGRRRG
jgi:hypothetical protein